MTRTEAYRLLRRTRHEYPHYEAIVRPEFRQARSNAVPTLHGWVFDVARQRGSERLTLRNPYEWATWYERVVAAGA